MVKLDISHHGEAGKVVHEFRPFVEERRIVFIPLHHEVVSPLETVARLKVLSDPSDEEVRVQPRAAQSPSDHGGRCSLSVRPCDDNGYLVVQEKNLERLRKGGIGNLVIQNVFDLGISPGEGIAHHDQVRLRLQVGKIISLRNADSLLREEIAHRRVDRIIGSGNLIATVH